MKVEREIAGITLPFIIGIAASAYAEALFHTIPHWSATSALYITLLNALFLLHPMHRCSGDSTIRCVIFIMMAACGVFTFTTDLLIVADTHNMILKQVSKAGQAMSENINRIPFRDATANAMIDALLTGDRSGLSKEVTEAFRNSGASHILAISGFHLGIIHSIIKKGLFILGNSPEAKRLRSIMTIAICGLYCLATGASPSITRAFIFIVLYETGTITGRYKDIRHVVQAALLIQLSISPGSIKDVGFQLSYAAMAGIAYINPVLARFWPEKDKSIPGRLWRASALSISCQITTGPVAYVYFSTLPKYFLLTNLIALPLTGIIIPVSLATLVLDSLGACPEMLLRATEMLIKALTEALRTISSM